MKKTSALRTGACYIRVSTGKQEELSPDAQKRLLLDYAKKNSIIVEQSGIFLENGISGRKADKRPKFQDMIARAKSKEHPYDIILVWKFSRFARNQEESIVYKSMLRKDRVDVVSVSEPISDDPFGTLIERIIEWMDEYYSIRLSGEVFRGMTENAMRGKYQARPPLGYKVMHHKETPVIVPAEAQTVQLIFNMYTEQNVGIFEIAKYLNEHGYQTSHKKQFERRSIEYIIKNPSYTGKTVWNRTSSEDSSPKDKSEWIIADGLHEAIISEEQFEKAKKRYESEYHPRKQRPPSTVNHWLSGVVKCSSCGRSLSTSVHQDARYGRTYTNFQCYGYLKGKCNSNHQISEKKLAPKVLEGIKEVLDSKDFKFEIKRTSNPEEDKSTEILELRLADIENKEKRIKQAYRDGIDTIDEYKENKHILAVEREELEQRIKEQNSEEPEDDKEEISEIMLDRVSHVYELLLSNATTTEKNLALKSIAERIVFDRLEYTVDIYYYYS